MSTSPPLPVPTRYSMGELLTGSCSRKQSLVAFCSVLFCIFSLLFCLFSTQMGARETAGGGLMAGGGGWGVGGGGGTCCTVHTSLHQVHSRPLSA